jgi:hypothetical protein
MATAKQLWNALYRHTPQIGSGMQFDTIISDLCKDEEAVFIAQFKVRDLATQTERGCFSALRVPLFKYLQPLSQELCLRGASNLLSYTAYSPDAIPDIFKRYDIFFSWIVI